MVVGALDRGRGGRGARLPGDPPPRHLRRAGHAGLRPDVRGAPGAAHLGVGWQRQPPARRCPDRRCSASTSTSDQQLPVLEQRAAGDPRRLATIAIRQGTTGRFLDAVRGSEAAAAAIGINANRQRLIVFVVGAGGGRVRRRPAGQLHRPGQLQRQTSSSSSRWCGWCWSSPPARDSCRRRSTSGITFFLFPELLNSLFTWVHGFVAVRERQLVAGRGLRPVRLRRLHLRQAPRGHHRGPDDGEHRQVGRLRRSHPGSTTARTTPPVGRAAPRSETSPDPALADTARAAVMATLLEATDITKHFRGITALDRRVRRGRSATRWSG